jgi:hypothetical protein
MMDGKSMKLEERNFPGDNSASKNDLLDHVSLSKTSRSLPSPIQQLLPSSLFHSR